MSSNDSDGTWWLSIMLGVLQHDTSISCRIATA